MKTRAVLQVALVCLFGCVGSHSPSPASSEPSCSSSSPGCNSQQHDEAATAILPVELISKKRDGGELTCEEIRRFVTGFHTGEISDYQMTAMLMAIYIKGMSSSETAHLTKAMVDTGHILDLSALGDTVDKHSTGGATRSRSRSPPWSPRSTSWSP